MVSSNFWQSIFWFRLLTVKARIAVLTIYLIPVVIKYLFGHQPDVMWHLYLLPAVISACSLGLFGATAATVTGIIIIGGVEVTQLALDPAFSMDESLRITLPVMASAGISAFVIGLLAHKLQYERASRLEMQAVVQENRDKIRYLTIYDGLTGLYNHRHFYYNLTRKLQAARANRDDLALIMIDIDNFKYYNDTFGRQQGDEILKSLAASLRKTVPELGVSARYGGEEFAVILPGFNLDRAGDLAEQIRKEAEDLRLPPDDINFTVSIGVAVFPYDAREAGELIEKAEEALRRAKFQDKNKVQVYSSIIRQLKKDLRIEKKQYHLISTYQTLLRLIDARDRYTFNHSQQVAEYAAGLAAKLGLTEDEVRRIRQGALFHDIGKIEIPRSILNQKGKLSGDEWFILQQHVSYGVEMLKPIEDFKSFLPMVQFHHERFDGRGYPHGLAGPDIPLEARILAVADSYDAMRSNRPYRAALSRQQAVEELQRCAGAQFDPDLVAAFVPVVKEIEGNSREIERN